MKIHNIKLDIHFCDDVLDGRKNFEIRYNDRGYQAGDLVNFIPVDGSFTEYHRVQYKTYEITYVLGGWGLKEGYVVFGIKPYKAGEDKGVLEQLAEKQNNLSAINKAWSDAIEKNGYVN